MVHSSRARRFVLSLVSAALVYFSMAATVSDAAEGPLVPVRYITTKSDQYSDADTDPDLSCTPQDNLTVSCPGRDGRLFDMVHSSRVTNMKWKISHHWQSSEGRENVHVELVFPCPVTISAMTWHFFQDSDAHVPSSSNWSVTAIAPNGTDNTSQFIKGMPTSQGEAFKLSMTNISGFPASSLWRIIVPLPSSSNWLFLNELDILGELVNRIVPQSYSITKSGQFININPDDKAPGCTTVGETTNCSTPGRLFDGVKAETANNASLFHLWQFNSDSAVQLMFMFQEPVIIEKLVWTFYYNTEAQHEALHIPAANITQWSLTAINMSDLIVTTRTVHNLLVYTMVVQGSMAAQRWGSTFSAPAGHWLLLSEVETFGTNAVEPLSPVDPTSPVEPLSPSPSSTTTSTVVSTFIQLLLRPVSDCLTWAETDGNAKLSEILAAISDPLQQQCSCSLSVQQRFFICFSTTDSQTVVFLAELSYTALPGVDMTSLLTSWVTSTPHITVASTQLQVDTTCPVVIDSLQPEPCSAASVAPSTVPPADPSSNPATDSPTDATVIVIVVAVAVVALLVMVTAIVAIVIAVIIFCSKQSKYSPRPGHSLPNPVHEEYEYMGNVSGGMAMTSMTKNPSYMTPKEVLTSGGSGGVAMVNMTENPSYTTTKEVMTSFTYNAEEDKANHTYEVVPFELNEGYPDNPTQSGQETAADKHACE